MHAFLIRDEGLCARPARFHQELLTMTLTARRGNVGVIDFRARIAGWQNIMGVAVTIHATRRRGAVGLLRLGVIAMLIGRLRIRMALGAAYLRGRRLMGG